jgi:hypothetical protein
MLGGNGASMVTFLSTAVQVMPIIGIREVYHVYEQATEFVVLSITVNRVN